MWVSFARDRWFHTRSGRFGWWTSSMYSVIGNALWLTFAPVTLGAGQPLFPRPFNLRLREHGGAGPFLAAVYDVLGARGETA